MVDTPANQAPVETAVIEHLYGRGSATTGKGFVKYLISKFAHSVGLTVADKGKLFYVDANGDVVKLSPGSATAIPYINSSGLPAWSAAGIDNQVMQLTAGVPTWGGNPSALVFLQAQSASANTSVDFTSGFSSTYDEYVFDLIGVYPSTAESVITMRVSEDGGSSYHATNYFEAHHGWIIGVTNGLGNGGNAVTAHNFHGAGITVGPNNTAADALTGQARLLLTTTRAVIQSNAGWKNANATAANQLGIMNAWSQRATTARVNAVRFLAASGNINGKILMYGVKNV